MTEFIVEDEDIFKLQIKPRIEEEISFPWPTQEIKKSTWSHRPVIEDDDPTQYLLG